MLARVNASAIVGLDAVPVEVEVDIASQGLPSFTIVGLPDKAVEEAKERVRSAIKNTGADFPAKRITVNLAPADLPKEGPAYDLPIALGILLASEQIKADVSDALFMGELSLDGRLRHINGVLSHAISAKDTKKKRMFLPKENSCEATIIPAISVFAINSLESLLHHLSKTKLLLPEEPITIEDLFEEAVFDYDMAAVKGQEKVKRALEIAAAGGHNILLKGPPGAGKTLIAKTFPSILPKLTFDEALEVTKIYSIAGLLENKSLVTNRPFRNPHHTTSHIGLIGGSATPKPGEISLAHRGVLFLDEFPEFPRHTLEALRQPIEDAKVSISRASARVTFPAKFMLIAAQNPCPCGYFGDSSHQCTCTSSQILRYQKRVSGPLLDRIDIHVDMPPVTVTKLTHHDESKTESSKTIQKRVQNARDRQTKRFKSNGIATNAEMTNKDIKQFCKLSKDCIDLLQKAIVSMKLSARAYHRILKLSRTIADLSDSETIMPMHIAESLQYRPRA